MEPTPTNAIYDEWTSLTTSRRKGYFSTLQPVQRRYRDGASPMMATTNYPGYGLVWKDRRTDTMTVRALVMLIMDDDTVSQVCLESENSGLTGRFRTITEGSGDKEIQLRLALFNFSNENIRFKVDGFIDVCVFPDQCMKLPGTSDNDLATPIVINRTGLRVDSAADQRKMPSKEKSLQLSMETSTSAQYSDILLPFNAGDRVLIYDDSLPTPFPRTSVLAASSSFGITVADGAPSPPMAFSCTVGKGAENTVTGGSFTKYTFHAAFRTKPVEIKFDMRTSDASDRVFLLPGCRKFSCCHSTHNVENGDILSAVLNMECSCKGKGDKWTEIVSFLEGEMYKMLWKI